MSFENIAPVLRRPHQFAQEEPPLSPVVQQEHNAVLREQNKLLQNELDDAIEQLVATKNRQIASECLRLKMFFPAIFYGRTQNVIFAVVDDDVDFAFSVDVVPLNVEGLVTLNIEPSTAVSCSNLIEIKSLNLHVYEGQFTTEPDLPSVTILKGTDDDDIKEIEIALTHKLVFISLRFRNLSSSPERRSVRENDDDLPRTQTKQPCKDDESVESDDSLLPENKLF